MKAVAPFLYDLRLYYEFIKNLSLENVFLLVKIRYDREEEKVWEVPL